MTTSKRTEGSFLFVSTRYEHVRPDGDFYPPVMAAWSGMKIDPFVYLCNHHPRIADVRGFHRPVFGNGTAYYAVDVKPPTGEEATLPFTSDPIWLLLDLERQANALVKKGVITR